MSGRASAWGRALGNSDALKGAYELFLGDMSRLYQLLPGALRLQVSGLFLGMLLSAGMEVLAISMLALLGMSVAAPEATAAHPVFSKILAALPALKSFTGDPMRFVLLQSLLVLCIFVLKNSLQVTVMWRVARMGEVMSLHFGEAILRRFLCSPYMWHISADSGRTFSALSGREGVANMMVQLLTMYVYAITSLALFITLLSATPGAIFGAVLATALAAVAIYRGLKNRIDAAGVKVLHSWQGQNKSLMDAMNGIREVLIYRQQPVFLEAYLRACRMGSMARSFLCIAPPIPAWVLECMGISVIPLSIWVLCQQEGATLGEVASVISLVMLTAWRILPMVNRALGAIISLRSVRPQALEALRVFEEMRAQPSVELPEPDPDFRFNTGITFDRVGFRYPGAQADALHELSFTIPKGAQVGVVGLSGAGKSTIAGVLSGLMEPTEGRILVDGKPLGRPQLSAFMSKVGYVPQTPYILGGTIAENVAFSHWGREYDRDRVLQVCRMAALDIVDQGAGVDTVVGERGGGLSGGQVQRVSIARALFNAPELLILDESTSSLDQANEDAIMETINSYRGRITTVIVAHRLTTLANCDAVIWLEGGRLAGQGPAKPLLERYRAHMAQVRQEE